MQTRHWRAGFEICESSRRCSRTSIGWAMRMWRRWGSSVPPRAYRQGSSARLGVEVALSSDLPVIPGRPLDVIRSAMERKTPRGVELGPHHAVPVMDAIKGYTWGSAFATHSEEEKGTLAPGLLADFTVLSQDPVRTGLDDWDAIQVVQTVVGGRVMYRG